MKKPYLTTEWFDEETGAVGYLVIDKMVDGFTAGGIRMREGLTKNEVQRLAEIMTIKMAGLGMNVGGAKGGINFPSDDPKSKDVLKRYLQAHLPYIKDCWLTSEDLGTREEDIAAILSQFGVKSTVQAFISRQENSHQLIQALQKAVTATYDGMKLTDLVTGYGVAIVAMKGLNTLGIDVKDAKISIQGFGSVGASAAKFLAKNGANIVAVADVNGTIYCSDGLDIELLLGLKDPRGNISREGLPDHYEQLPSEDWLSKEVDVLIPAAIADVIHENNVSDINARLIVEAANIPVTEKAEKVLFERGILVIPDFIANSGGAGLFVAVLDGGASGEAEEIFAFLKSQLSKTTKQILDSALNNKQTPRMAARELVLTKIK